MPRSAPRDNIAGAYAWPLSTLSHHEYLIFSVMSRSVSLELRTKRRDRAGLFRGGRAVLSFSRTLKIR